VARVFCAVFSYWVGDRGAFERAYGPDGTWAELFRRGEGYLGTELLAGGDGRYLLIDRWGSREAYESFLAAHRDEYERRSAEAEALYEREERVGLFEAVAGGGGLELRLLAERFAGLYGFG
jgi:heme-degrading monooxygenase HmoA